MTTTTVWKKLLEFGLVDNRYDAKSRRFAIKTYQNDIKYLHNNYRSITDNNTKNDCLLIACTFLNDVKTISF